ncbi:HET-domain-containing protein [Hypoxylon rubiginosum]|uniref:HET-domain-containing protein n=1 Tax=Hypoxylon rubiginosum TaxID=110542 RepID=A0ACC0CM62_9PEZI|nr:HET-domain-containing protein [Hypoxylon rubiginosum]
MSASPYRPLDSEDGEIRLLELFPAPEHSAPIVCALHPVKLGTKPSYEALSYTWGGKGAGTSITLDGFVLGVFENLEAVLRRLRRPKKPRTLWIDAICINQDDLDERANQVKLMRAVYEGASGVTIWLGEPGPGAELGLNRLTASNSITRRTKNRDAHWTVEKELFGKAGGLGTETAMWFSPSTDLLRNELEKDEIRELLCRPWWTRVWIIQEAVVSKNLKVMCGSWEIDWDKLDAETKEENINTKQVALVKVMHPELLSFADSTLDDINLMRRKWGDAKTGNNIYELLYNLRRLACTDPRDRIFAFLGLLSPDLGMILSPDYKRSIGEIYTRICRAVILKAKTLDILNCTRQWRGVSKLVTNSRVYSVYERAKYHDTSVMVQAEGDPEPSGGSARLPAGWERCIEGGVVTYFDHNTQTRHNESPIAGKVHPLASRLERQTCPEGCRKTWDDVGRPSIKFNVDEKTVPIWSEDEFPGLPLWVPNWAARSSQDPRPFLDWSKKIDDPGPFHASGNSYAEVSPDLDDQILSLSGLEFDTIEGIAAPWHPKSELKPLSRWGIPELQQWTTLASQDHPTCPYGGPEGRLEAIWRTHLGDHPGDGAVPAADRVFVECWFDKEGWVAGVGEIEAMDSYAAGGADDATNATRLLYEYWRKINGKGKFFNKLREMYDVWAVGRQYVLYLERLYDTCAHRALFVTSKGYIGLAPWNAKAGDKICLLSGGKTPFLLRETKEDSYDFVGECYVYGIMGGEAWTEKAHETFNIC